MVNDRQNTIYKLIQLQYYYKQKLKNSKKHLQTLYDVQDKWQIEDEVKRRIDGLNSKTTEPLKPTVKTYTSYLNKGKLDRNK